jgi:succinyl-CoA synthetase beta subunit
MKIHEFQAKQLFRERGVAVLRGIVAKTPAEAAKAYTELGLPIAVVKSQIHAGGRGKGTIIGNESQRGVQLVKSAADAEKVAAGILGKKLVTIQTGPEGQTVNQVFVEEGCDIGRELYLGIVLDRAASMPVLMMSTEGGVEIEKVAAETPDKILKEHFHPQIGIESYQIRKLCKKLGIGGTTVRSAEKFIKALCRAYVELDCSLVEINPLVITKKGEMVALDGKITFDDNGLIRHPELAALRDESEENPNELRASKTGLSYVQMDGNIGCLVNGAGLAMSTMDIIKYHGGEPANFLDVGGGANAEQVTEAFRIILSDKNVKGVLVNIFGGIMRCTTIAEALLVAYKTVGFTVPLVVRLEGTEVDQARKLLADSGVAIINATDLTEAAKKIVEASKKGAA